MKDDRSQNKNLIVKIYRWLKWKPIYFIKANLYAIKTLFDKDLLWDEEEKAYFKRRFIFELIYNEASSKMKHYYTFEEVNEHLNKKCL
jgi:hypothetical protein